jgi:bacillithiol biosynthesis deacetylase BshB1
VVDIIAVGAHPDDVEIGMGGTVAGLVRQGMSVLMVDLTDGEPTPFGTKEIRASESRAAAAALGAERVTLTLTNRELFDTVDARKMLAEIIRERRPRVLFAPYPIDSHPDHVAAAAICEAARFYGKFVKTDMSGEPHFVPRLYHYFAVHLRMVAKPSFIVDVSEDMPSKLEALAAYESQFMANERNASVLGWVRGQAAVWGGAIGTAAGEPFLCREEIGVRSVGDLL